MDSGLKDGKGAYDFTDHLSAYSTRVLFIASARNEVIGVAFQERQRQFFPAADLVTIADSGHDVPWTHPAETLAAIHAYLSVLGTVQRWSPGAGVALYAGWASCCSCLLAGGRRARAGVFAPRSRASRR